MASSQHDPVKLEDPNKDQDIAALLKDDMLRQMVIQREQTQERNRKIKLAQK